MTIRKYSDLLPSYLDGPNIQAHAELLETQDKKLSDKIDLLRLWNVLERPILFERIQEESGTCTINVHINSSSVIKSINITGDEDISEEYAEEELLTKKTYTFTVTGTTDPILPFLSVCVETYDDIVYEKAYPENDDEKGDLHDHDRFLDIIGSLLGVSRRKYKAFAQNKLSETYPPYFAKFDSDGVMIPGTEDDWYYKERLIYFITHFSTVTLPELMMKIVYEWDAIHTYNIYNRTTSLIEDYIGYFYMITTEDREAPSNIDDTRRQEAIQLYDQLTRPSYIAYTEDTTLDATTYHQFYPNYTQFLVNLVGESYQIIKKAPIDLVCDDKEAQTVVTKDDCENGYCLLEVSGFMPGEQEVTLQYPGEYEFRSSNTKTVIVDIDEDYNFFNTTRWKYAKQFMTTVPDSDIVAPRLTNEGYVSMGRGVLCYIPALYTGWLEDCIVRVKFYFGGASAQLSLSRIEQVTTNTIAPADNEMRVRPYLTLGRVDSFEHLLEFRFNNGVCHAYIDGRDTEMEKDYNGLHELLYILAYSPYPESDTNRRGLYISDIEIVRTPTKPIPSMQFGTTWDDGTLTVQTQTIADGTVTVKTDGEMYDEFTVEANTPSATELILDATEQVHNIRFKYKKNENYQSEINNIKTSLIDFNKWVYNTATADASGDTGTKILPCQEDSKIAVGQRYDTICPEPVDMRKQYTIFTNQKNRYLRVGLYKKVNGEYVPHKYKTLYNMGAPAHPNGQIKYKIRFDDTYAYWEAEGYPTTLRDTIDRSEEYYLGFYATVNTEQVELIAQHNLQDTIVL